MNDIKELIKETIMDNSMGGGLITDLVIEHTGGDPDTDDLEFEATFLMWGYQETCLTIYYSSIKGRPFFEVNISYDNVARLTPARFWESLAYLYSRESLYFQGVHKQLRFPNSFPPEIKCNSCGWFGCSDDLEVGFFNDLEKIPKNALTCPECAALYENGECNEK